ncbi:HAD family hydrolase [Pseudalkalibacillus hwajinpoensis]|uniref:Hydrolase (Had superfamily) n=1 Tax=Guptibacillus hwajinpoensis TaxID=208199 RepID=A0A4U1MDR0_9BACL|nr:HAD family hydrolase [Pseudalkalibacillus hwajinpoensis]TKD68266.1 hydrolase (had superfamily) [Pseudalkalibacillus hwajinpoensis]
MRAFASDLDRTLIYSNKLMKQFSEEDFQLIETLEGKEISYISNKTKGLLHTINKEMHFIPVTTRTIEQYRRISLFQDEIVPEYVVTSNGGHILRNGEILQDWSDHIKSCLEKCLPLDDFVNKLESLVKGNWIERIRDADHLFVYLIIKRDEVPSEELTRLFDWAREQGWQPSLQGRKLYFVPAPVNKWNAVDYLKKELSLTYIHTAGDSLLDYDLIQNGDDGYAPAHGEVLETYPDLRRTKQSGMKASEEIIESILGQLASHSTL